MWISSMKRMAPGFSASAFTTALETLLELAAKLRAGEQRAQIEGVERGVLEDVRHFLLVDGDRQPSASAVFPTPASRRRWVVLPAPAEHLHGCAPARSCARPAGRCARRRPARSGRRSRRSADRRPGRRPPRRPGAAACNSSSPPVCGRRPLSSRTFRAPWEMNRAGRAG